MSLNMRLARRWAAVPGVTFPEPMQRLITDKRCVTKKPAANEWIAAADLARHLNITSERANALGMRVDHQFCVYVDPINPMVRTRYFRKSKVMDAKVSRALSYDDYKLTHIPLKEVISCLGVGRNTVNKYVEQGKLHPVRVKGGGKRGTYYLYPKKEVAKIKH